MSNSKIKRLERRMEKASSYDEWLEAAQAYDEAQGLERWIQCDQSDLYDYTSIRIRLDRLRAMRARDDDRGLLFALNEGIHGNMGGMGKEALYNKAKSGTKKLVVEYVDEIVAALEHLSTVEEGVISLEEKVDFFRRASHCFGASAMMMSGSGHYHIFHAGVVKALLEQGLLPNIISGASGGAIIGSIICSHTDEELKDIFQPEAFFNLLDLRSDPPKLRDKFFPEPVRAEEKQRLLDTAIPDITFQEAYERTGRHLNISVAPVENHQTSRLLNAMTSPNVYVREACDASSSPPGVFPSVMLMAKNDHGERQPYLPSRKWVDGSISDDLPAKRLGRLYGVNHYIVSQTNPLVVPFILGGKSDSSALSTLLNGGISVTRTLMNVSADVLEKPLSKWQVTEAFSNVMLSIINQDYLGDINMVLPLKHANPMVAMNNPSKERVAELMRIGEREAWKRMEMIRVQTKIGHTLERIIASFDEQFISRAAKPVDSSSTKEKISVIAGGKDGVVSEVS